MTAAAVLTFTMMIQGGVMRDARVQIAKDCECKPQNREAVCLIQTTSIFASPRNIVVLATQDGDPISGRVTIECKSPGTAN